MSAIDIVVPLTSIFIIINPFSKVPFFLLLTKDFTPEERRRVVWHAVRVSVAVLILFAFAGKYIFSLFSISALSMRVVGALVIAKVGFEMMAGKTPGTKPSSEERDEAVRREMVGVVPLGIPMIAGPGAIIVVMTFTANAEGVFDIVTVIGSIIITCIFTFLLLIKADRLYEKIGDVGLHTIMRLMGVIIAAIGVEMMLRAIYMFVEKYNF